MSTNGDPKISIVNADGTETPLVGVRSFTYEREPVTPGHEPEFYRRYANTESPSIGELLANADRHATVGSIFEHLPPRMMRRGRSTVTGTVHMNDEPQPPSGDDRPGVGRVIDGRYVPGVGETIIESTARVVDDHE